MPVSSPTASRPVTIGNPIVHIGAVFQRLADMVAARPAPDAKPRSVADLLEFGYVLSPGDHHFPHKPA